MIRTFTITFTSGRRLILEALSAAQVRRAVMEWSDESFSIKVGGA